MKNAAPTIARISQRRSAAGLIFLLGVVAVVERGSAKGYSVAPAVTPARLARVTAARFRHNAQARGSRQRVV
jgi:hypothetical protein